MITAIRRKIVLNAKDESGFGLSEFVVAIGLFSILATLIVVAFSTFTTTLTRDRAATTNTNVAAIGMDELTRVIRSATSIPVVNADDLPPFAYANKEKIILYAYIDTNAATPKPVKVQFEVNATTRDLVETRWAAHPKPGYPSYWEFDTTPQSSRVIARKIVAPGTGQPFTFNYQEIGADLLPDDMTIPATGITAANLSKIAVVEVTVKVQSDPTGRAAPVTMTNQVGIPNLGVSRLGLS
jgi:type II secretory pathway pseudopilin PulG